jgi:hypothetical protein
MYTVTVEPCDHYPVARYQVEINGTIVGYGWKDECKSLAEELTGDDEKCKLVLKSIQEIDNYHEI